MSEKLTIHKAAFDFQILIILEPLRIALQRLYEKHNITRDIEQFTNDAISALQREVKTVALDPSDPHNTATSDVVDAIEVFQTLAHQKFERKADNLCELHLFQTLAYIALYKHHMQQSNFSDAMSCIAYANRTLSRHNYTDVTAKVILSERARNSGLLTGSGGKEGTINYMKELLKNHN